MEKGDGEDKNIDTRGPVAYVTGLPADVAHLSRKIMEYRHFLNLYILLLDEVYRRAEPDKYEENFLRNEEYFALKDDKYVKRVFNRQEYSSENRAENKVALKYLSSPTVVRALFQKENMGANEKRKQTRLDNLRNQNPHLQAIVKTGISDKRAADFVTSILKEKKFFGDMMAAGANLKSHVIRNAVKTIKTARANAFENLKTTGRLHLPRAEKLDRCSNFFVDLCEVSSSKKGNQIKVNLDRNARTVTLSLDIARKEQGLASAKVTKIGLINGRLAVCLLYQKPKREVEPKEEKLAALDLGLKYLASIFIMDDVSPSLCIKNQHLIQYNARFNEFNSKINEELIRFLFNSRSPSTVFGGTHIYLILQREPSRLFRARTKQEPYHSSQPGASSAQETRKRLRAARGDGKNKRRLRQDDSASRQNKKETTKSFERKKRFRKRPDA